ncbi:aminoglycoside phosphotransferase family protein [Candidatus Bipolaricaulota bacterium]|nr:aminoglycoside phosphotransferase family protein [Candidatus Bipolaricaulota bacterium]
MESQGVGPLQLLQEAAHAFRLSGAITRIEEHVAGLIHDTFIVHTSVSNRPRRYILQRINQEVFSKPSVLMENIEAVIRHVQRKAADEGRSPERAIPSLIYTSTGQAWLHIADTAWRMMEFVEGTTTIELATDANQAREIGLVFGRFLEDLADFPTQELQIALPGYRDTARYLNVLWDAVDTDIVNRAQSAREEIAFAERNMSQAMRLQELQRTGLIPVRAIHGDTKINNVLVDCRSGVGVCAIDLDTVMPGLRLHDIGNCVAEVMVGNSAPQDSLAGDELDVFEALIEGFTLCRSRPLTVLECESLIDAVRSLTLELGVRFLADYVAGDTYFKTTFAEENRVRARRHFELARRLELNRGVLQSRVQCLGERSH